MPTSVPPVTFGPTGFIAPAAPLVLAGVQADISAAFQSVLNYNLNTPQGQLSSSEAALVVNTNAIFVYYTNQVDPAFAIGRMQDAIARISFLERLPALPTVLTIQCFGLAGVVIPVGSLIRDTAQNLYASTDPATIASNGNVTTAFAAVLPGATPIPASNAVSIYQAIPGWDSVSTVSGVVGRPVETRAQFEARRQATVAANSRNTNSAVRGVVLQVPGVLDAYVIDNPSSSPATIGGVTLAAKSIYVAVVGGLAADVANAIWTKKPPGCGYNGNTTVTVFDQNSGYSPPLPSYPVTFNRPSNLAILFNVVVINGPLVPSDATTQIQNALLSAFAGAVANIPKASIGATLNSLQYAPALTSLGSWAQLSALGIGSNNTTAAVFDAVITGTSMVVNAVVSGTLAVGQTVSDAAGAIVAGTRITAGPGGGGTGTYTINNAHTLGATFTGNGSGLNLTASAVTGLIAPGDLVTGTGVPANTVIVSQTSGPPGGAGVYVTNNVTTSSGASLTASDVVTSAVNTGNTVVLRIDQEPTLNVNDIVVSTT